MMDIGKPPPRSPATQGILMFGRISLIAALALSSAGCSGAPLVNAPSGLTSASLQPISPAAASTAIGQIDIEAELSKNRTMGGKVLTAIALERVTGRKPDPARLSVKN